MSHLIGASLKGKNLLLKEQILSFRVAAILTGISHPEKQIGTHKKYFS